MLGSWEFFLIIFFIIILFGPNKIPELFKYLQKGTQDFKKSFSDSDKINRNNVK